MEDWERFLVDACARADFKSEFPWNWQDQPEGLKDIYRDIVHLEFLFADADNGGVIYVSTRV